LGPFARKNSRKEALRAASLAARALRHSPAGLTAIAALLLLSSLINPGLWQGPRGAVTDAVAPLISAVSLPFQVAADIVGNVTGLTQIRAENDRLREENTRLKEWYQTALLLRAENQSLKDLLNVIPEPDQSYISTRVIGDSGSSFVQTLLIQAGTEDGVREGQAVMGPQGMIGRIIETGSRAARVLVLTDINSRIPVTIEGANQRAVLGGTNGDYLTLDHLPPDALIEEGARIVTSGHGGMFPAGLPVGEVVKTSEGQMMVRLYSDPANASYVQVIEKPDDPNVRRSVGDLTAPLPAEGETR
jgi:rod shape-determining protein MreC